MDLQHMQKEAEKRLVNARYEHVLRVRNTALALAEHFNVPEEKVEAAALLHDIAKCMEIGRLRNMMLKANEDPRLLLFPAELWHAPAGEIIAKNEFLIDDPDILSAIRFHTTGRRGMGNVEKIIYIADLIEPGRSFPGIDELRNMENKTLDEVMTSCVAHTIAFLLQKRQPVFPDSIDCYNELVLT